MFLVLKTVEVKWDNARDVVLTSNIKFQNISRTRGSNMAECRSSQLSQLGPSVEAGI